MAQGDSLDVVSDWLTIVLIAETFKDNCSSKAIMVFNKIGINRAFALLTFRSRTFTPGHFPLCVRIVAGDGEAPVKFSVAQFAFVKCSCMLMRIMH